MVPPVGRLCWREGSVSANMRRVKKTSFPTPQDCEAAFYEAIESADLEAMMEVWAEDEEIVCIHPTGARLTGYEQVRESWSQIFNSRQRLRVHLSNQVYVHGMMLSIHSLHENILVAGAIRAAGRRERRSEGAALASRAEL